MIKAILANTNPMKRKTNAGKTSKKFNLINGVSLFIKLGHVVHQWYKPLSKIFKCIIENFDDGGQSRL